MIVEKLRNILDLVRKNGVLDVESAMARGRVYRRRADVDVAWLITNINDEIQSKQLADGFYEIDELRTLKHDVPDARHILDIGANIGNHSIYFAKAFAAERVIPVEPYAPAIRHLLANIALNYSPCFDLRFLGRAIGAQLGTVSLAPPTKFNIGLTRVVADDLGVVPLITGDSIVGDDRVDLIKVDVEGMEVDVIAGLTCVLARQKPALFVEVGDDQRADFIALTEQLNYAPVREVRAYGSQTNFTMKSTAA